MKAKKQKKRAKELKTATKLEVQKPLSKCLQVTLQDVQMTDVPTSGGGSTTGNN